MPRFILLIALLFYPSTQLGASESPANASRTDDYAIKPPEREPEKNRVSSTLSITQYRLKDGFDQEAADHLAMSERTLRRHLVREGITYKQVILDFRMEIAASFVRNKAVPLLEASYASGYSDPANFHRAFSKYFGSTPKQYRDDNSR